MKSYPRRENGKIVPFPPELGADFLDVLHEIVNPTDTKSEKKPLKMSKFLKKK